MRSAPDIHAAATLRHDLHAHPELSGREHATVERVRAFFEPLRPDEVVTGLGGSGLAVAFGKADRGPTVLLRCELDALPIQESNRFAHRSRLDGCSHKCGHDGHMAILAAVGAELSVRRPESGRVVLLFQPAEETGTGAAAVVGDPQFERIRPHVVFGLHNLPGYPLGQVVVRDGTFTCASRGMTVRLRGKPAHAAQPETGISPARAMARIVMALNDLPRSLGRENELMFATVVGASTGGPNFGIAPGSAEVHATLRSETDDTMDRLLAHCESLARAEAAASGLHLSLSCTDVFDATVNAPAAVDAIRRACEGSAVLEAPAPFRWSEDFGRLTQIAEGAFFGLGAGERAPALHHEDYDFPDELIAIGAAIFLRIVDQCLREPERGSESGE